MSKINKLNKAYKKRFKCLNNNLLAKKESDFVTLASDAGLVFFVEHLKYLRDIYIVARKSPDAVATLNAAIVEFEAFKDSKKDFHWNNFCEFVKLNMKEWLAANDTV